MAPNIPESNNSINVQWEANKKMILRVLCILENSEFYYFFKWFSKIM